MTEARLNAGEADCAFLLGELIVGSKEKLNADAFSSAQLGRDTGYVDGKCKPLAVVHCGLVLAHVLLR